ncbi:MAG: hypothetical protein HND53_09225 [Proteobacteria bacterium]|nr:hypothetical protein [Pseudomonadota bacterium]NOG60667.1 hypothetical protein [Pseudomonadota bacterium]
MSKAKLKWLKITFLFYCLFGLMFTTITGYATYITLSKLSDSPHYDSFDKINYSYADDNTLVICVSGVMAGNVLKQDYQLSVPLDKLTRYKHKKGDLSKLENYYLDRQFISRQCINSDNKIIPEHIETPVVNIPDALKELNLQLQDNRVYEVTKHWGSVNNKTMETKGKRIFYTVPVTENGPDVVEIKTKQFHGKGSKTWFLVLPLAVIVDTLSFPIQIAMWINYASAH